MKIYKLVIRRNDKEESLVDVWRYNDQGTALLVLTQLRYLFVTLGLNLFVKLSEEEEG